MIEMFLTKASEADVAKKIKEDISWLTQERLQYIVEKRSGLFHYLKPDNINIYTLKNILVKEDLLLNFAFVFGENEDWKSIIRESIPRPLTNMIFEKYGVLLKFFEEKEYENLAKNWIKTIKSDTFVPDNLIKLLNEKQILSSMNNRYQNIDFKLLSEDVKTKKVCLAFLEKTHQPHELYGYFPQEIKDDDNIAYRVCKNNKQFYKKLTPKAQCGARLIAHVIDDVIYPSSDTDSFHTDETAINPKKLSLEAVFSVKNSYTMKKIFNKNKNLLNNKEIQKKWFTTEENQSDLIEYFDYFPKEAKEKCKENLKSLDSWEKAINLMRCPQLKDVIVDKNNIKDCLVILFAAHMNSKNFKQALCVTGLENIMSDNLSQYITQYSKEYDQHSDKIRFLDIADWLLKKKTKSYKKVAIELLSKVLEKAPRALEVDFGYHYGMESSVLKNIAPEVYEFMDSKTSTNKSAKKKMV